MNDYQKIQNDQKLPFHLKVLINKKSEIHSFYLFVKLYTILAKTLGPSSRTFSSKSNAVL